jgi:hypothetical protein
VVVAVVDSVGNIDGSIDMTSDTASIIHEVLLVDSLHPCIRDVN